MKTPLISKVLAGALVALGPMALNAFAAATITLSGGIMADSSGTPLVDGRLLQLIASPGDLDFSAPTETDFVSDDDIVLATFQVDSATTGNAGSILIDLIVDFDSNPTLSEGASLLLRWFDISAASSEPGVGASYGQFRTDSIVDQATSAWFMPGDGSSISLSFVTQSVGGSQVETAGEASAVAQAAIPEPASAALWLALICGLRAAARRRRAA